MNLAVVPQFVMVMLSVSLAVPGYTFLKSYDAGVRLRADVLAGTARGLSHAPMSGRETGGLGRSDPEKSVLGAWYQVPPTWIESVPRPMQELLSER